MSHAKNGTTGFNHMNKRQLAEGLEFLDDLTEEERKRFEALPDEDKHRCIAQNLSGYRYAAFVHLHWTPWPAYG